MLVERIINKVLNENIDIDKILVVTFTNAAASEMRERILDAIYKKIEEEPDNIKLQRQITLLNMANICTIDSFCLDIAIQLYNLQSMYDPEVICIGGGISKQKILIEKIKKALKKTGFLCINFFIL